MYRDRIITVITSDQRNLTRPHCYRRRTVKSYSPGGANMPSHECTLAQPGEYDWTCVSFSSTRVLNPNGKSIGSAIFAQLTATLFPSKLPFPWGRLDPYLIMFPSAHPSHNRNGISIGSAIFAGLTTVTDRPCYSVGNNSSTANAMRPYNNNDKVRISIDLAQHSLRARWFG